MKWIWPGLLVLLASCAKEEHSVDPDGSAWAHIFISDESGKTPSSYSVTVDSRLASCGLDQESDSVLQCTSQGLEWHADGRMVPVVAKSSGYATEATTVDFGKTRDLSIVLHALPAFTYNESEASGFNAKEGFAMFRSMAYKTSSELGESYFLKFFIGDWNGRPVVHFINTNKYPLHYSFAHDILGETRSVRAFENDIYHSENRSAVAGTLVYYANRDSALYLSFFAFDNISNAQLVRAHRLLEERLLFLGAGNSPNRLFYLPTGSDAEARLAHAADTLTSADIKHRTYADLTGNAKILLLNAGTAFGTLRRLTPEQLDTAVLSAHDIVLLTRLPAELPLVGGTISVDGQTPLSHVNLAARARNTPNLSFNGNAIPDTISALVDSLVAFRVNGNGYTLVKASLAEAQAYWDSRSKKLFVPAFDLSVTGLPDFAELGFTAAKIVGVKAANLAELHHLLPDQSPDGFAVPFYHYDQFLNTAMVTDSLCQRSYTDCGKEGRDQSLCRQWLQTCSQPAESTTLNSLIASTIKRDDFRSDARLRATMLEGIGYLIRHAPPDSQFAKQLNEKVRTQFGTAKVRLRSSTNAEDLDEFNGAGLYESVSASGRPGDLPSEEIRKVWASVWSFRAYEERTWWNMDQLTVKMGVAVHLAYPDEIANGVIVSQNIASPAMAGIYVNLQLGETSITNPDDGSRPEIVTLMAGGGEVQSVRLQYSSLSPNKEILTSAESQELYNGVQKIQQHFAQLYQKSAAAMLLDIEFKLIDADRKLLFKQVRPYIP